MGNRDTVNNLTGRMYKHHLKHTGRLPTDREKRLMERKAQKVAETVDNKKKRG